MIKTISILGLGWLGLPLAKNLLSQGFTVKGSVTNAEKAEELESSGIDVSILNVTPDNLKYSDSEFFRTDLLFINIPPRRIPNIETVYPAQLKQLIPVIIQHNIKKVMFISSTSVYPENNGIVTELDFFEPDKASGVACLAAEKKLQLYDQFSTTVIRFGGLIGADRNPHRFMQRGMKNGSADKPVNLIHLDDCIGIVKHIIQHEIWDELINACCPEHPTREEFYSHAAKVAGVKAPEFEHNEEFHFKKVSSKKLIDELGYRFKFKNPLEYVETIKLNGEEKA